MGSERPRSSSGEATAGRQAPKPTGVGKSRAVHRVPAYRVGVFQSFCPGFRTAGIHRVLRHVCRRFGDPALNCLLPVPRIMASTGIDTGTVLKILLAILAAVVAFVLLGELLSFLGRIVWFLVGILVLAVLALLAVKLLRDLL